MIGAGSTTFSYYNNGNRISRTEGLVTTRYSYDFEDRMTKAGSKSYQRDHFGRVVSSGGGAIRYLFERGERDPGGGGGYYDPTHSGVR